MGTQVTCTGRKRLPNRERLTAEDDALNQIAREAEARLAVKRAARAEAREIRMKELERQQKEISDDEERMSVGSRGSLRVEERSDRDFLEKGSRTASTLSAATLASLGGASSRRGSCDTSISVDTEASIRDIKDSLVESEEKFRKAMVSNAQLDNEKSNLMYQVDTLKESLIELEEQLWETKREYVDKAKEFERERHAHSLLQRQFTEMKETLKQSEDLLTKHGIPLSPEVTTNGDAGQMTDEPFSADYAALLSEESQPCHAGESVLGKVTEEMIQLDQGDLRPSVGRRWQQEADNYSSHIKRTQGKAFPAEVDSSITSCDQSSVSSEEMSEKLQPECTLKLCQDTRDILRWNVLSDNAWQQTAREEKHPKYCDKHVQVDAVAIKEAILGENTDGMSDRELEKANFNNVLGSTEPLSTMSDNFERLATSDPNLFGEKAVTLNQISSDLPRDITHGHEFKIEDQVNPEKSVGVQSQITESEMMKIMERISLFLDVAKTSPGQTSQGSNKTENVGQKVKIEIKFRIKPPEPNSDVDQITTEAPIELASTICNKLLTSELPDDSCSSSLCEVNEDKPNTEDLQSKEIPSTISNEMVTPLKTEGENKLNKQLIPDVPTMLEARVEKTVPGAEFHQKMNVADPQVKQEKIPEGTKEPEPSSSEGFLSESTCVLEIENNQHMENIQKENVPVQQTEQAETPTSLPAGGIDGLNDNASTKYLDSCEDVILLEVEEEDEEEAKFLGYSSEPAAGQERQTIPEPVEEHVCPLVEAAINQGSGTEEVPKKLDRRSRKGKGKDVCKTS